MDIALLALGVGGSLGVMGGALALGLRHGIDWDHIAAITDITSTTAANEPHEKWLIWPAPQSGVGGRARGRSGCVWSTRWW